MNDAIRWAVKRGHAVVPVLEVVWKARNATLSTERFCTIGQGFREAAVQPRVTKGGWSEITEGPAITGGSVTPATTSVTIEDAKQETLSFLERYKPKYSTARVWMASPELAAADWALLFDGLVDGWRMSGPNLTFALGSDDRVLSGETPKPTFDRTVWGSAADQTIFGQAIPFLMGVHDSLLVTARGMVPAINVVWDDLLGHKWLMSGKGMKALRRVYYDGVIQASGLHTMETGVYGSCEVSLFSCAKDDAPEDANAAVAFDCEGPDITGRTVDDCLTNPARQLRLALINYVFGDLRYGPYETTHPRIHAASWDALEAFLDGDDSGIVIGGHREKQTGNGLIESFGKGKPPIRFYWTATGQLAVMIVNVQDSDPPEAYVNLSTVAPSNMEHGPESSDLNTGIKTSFLYSQQEQKFLSDYTAEDLNLRDYLGQANEALVEDLWTQARFKLE